jgi:hypothetical protein
MEQHCFPSCDWILITTWKVDYKTWLPILTQPPPYSNLIPNYPFSTSNSQLKMPFIISTPTKDLWSFKTPNSCPRLLTSQGFQLLPKMKLNMTFNFPWPTKFFDYLQCFKIPNLCHKLLEIIFNSNSQFNKWTFIKRMNNIHILIVVRLGWIVAARV